VEEKDRKEEEENVKEAIKEDIEEVEKELTKEDVKAIFAHCNVVEVHEES
jgi:hypothetical protein